MKIIKWKNEGIVVTKEKPNRKEKDSLLFLKNSVFCLGECLMVVDDEKISSFLLFKFWNGKKVYDPTISCWFFS